MNYFHLFAKPPPRATAAREHVRVLRDPNKLKKALICLLFLQAEVPASDMHTALRMPLNAPTTSVLTKPTSQTAMSVRTFQPSSKSE